MKPLILFIGICLLSSPLSAMELKSNEGKDYGKIDAELKAMSVLGAKSNGYDPKTGTAYLVKLKYSTPYWNHLQLGIGFYNTGDLFGLTDFDSGEKIARGLFVTNDGSEKSLMGEGYLRYKRDEFTVDLGRQLYQTPLTTIPYSTMPNFHTVFGVNTTALPDFEFSLAQVTEMSFGARAMTDFGLIGEGTGTAGAAVIPALIGQAEFHKISKITLGEGAPDTSGITVFNAIYSGFKKTKISLWNYYAYDIANNFLLQGDMGFPIKGFKLKLAAQYLRQQDVGDSLADDLDFNLFGVKAALQWEKWLVYGAYNNSSGDTGMLNAWGGDPAYTSSIFSRNEYRKHVNAFKIGFRYNILRNLAFMASYANYGKSESIGKIAGVGSDLTALTNATETDLILVYKPVKGLMVRLFYANRTSEYDGSNGRDLTQGHTRIIVSYTF
jgi:hypothetical protein